MTARPHRPILAALALALAACGRGGVEDRPRVVLLVVLDALAAGHVSHLGYERATTPELDALADEGAAFERAIAPASYTVASIPSLFTGRVPDRHGLVGEGQALSEDETTLAELVRAAGYRTCAVVCNTMGGPRHGLGQGFEELTEVYDGPGPRGDGKRGPRGRLLHVPTAAEILPVVRERLARLQPDERLFLYLHVLEPHGPYDPPLEYKRSFQDARCPEAYEEGEREQLQARMKAGDLGPAVREGVERLYDSNVRWADAHLGLVLDELRARDLYDDALIVVTSDHGEAFWEHGWHGHGANVYGELARVPLVVRAPGTQAARVPAAVGLVDVVPTLVELLGLELPPAELDGRSLVPLLRDATGPSPHESLLVRSHPGAHVYARVEGDAKVVGSVEPDAEGELQLRSLELYDLATDPGETRDLAAEEPERSERLGAELLAELRALRRAARPAPPARRPPDQPLLEALGYAGGDDG